MNRRQFLILSGAMLSAAIIPAVGYSWLKSNWWDDPDIQSPYAVDETPGPGARLPILLIIPENATSPFGPYLDEILRAEGIPSFARTALSQVSLDLLSQYDMAIIAAGAISQVQAAMLTDYVQQGGRLIGMRPGVEMAALFGLKPLGAQLADAWLLADQNHSAGQGINPEPLRIAAEADLYQVEDAAIAAWLVGAPESDTRYPGVVTRPVGKGWTCAWVFDLPRSIVLSRQGKPELSNSDSGGLPENMSADQLYDLMDMDRLKIPRADEQQRLLANILNRFSAERQPLVRLWYFPEDAQSVLLATGDSHNNSAASIEDVLSRFERYGATATVYYTPPKIRITGRAMSELRWFAAERGLIEEVWIPSPEQVQNWRDRGHEFSLHPVVSDGLENLNQGIKDTWLAFTRLGYGAPGKTIRSHAVFWHAWVETARWQAAYGMRMNLDYYHFGQRLIDQNTWLYGFINGSGLPMRFVDQHGRLLNIFQQVTHLVDEQVISMPYGGAENLPLAQAVKYSRDLFATAIAGAYAAIGGQFHFDPFDMERRWYDISAAWLEGTLTAAVELGLPILSAERWLEFTQNRHAARFDEYHWNGAELNLTMNPPDQAAGRFSLLIPMQHGTLTLREVTIQGSASPLHPMSMAGVKYARVILPSGKVQIRAGYGSS